MTLSEFENLIAAYGSNPDKWPDGIRRGAQNFMQTHENETAQSLLEAARLDQALDSFETPLPSDLLKGRILRSLPPQSSVSASAPTSSAGWQKIAAMVVAAFGLGFGGSQYLVIAGGESAPEVLVADNSDESVWLQTAEDLGFSDVYYWVEGEDT